MTGRPIRRRAAALALAVVAVSGLGLASAAQLSINSRVIQAGSAAVGTCQPPGTPVRVGFTSTFSTANPRRYNTTAVTLSDVAAACEGHSYRLRLLDTSGALLGTERTGTVTLGGGSTLTIPVTSVPTASVARVAVLIFN